MRGKNNNEDCFSFQQISFFASFLGFCIYGIGQGNEGMEEEEENVWSQERHLRGKGGNFELALPANG